MYRGAHNILVLSETGGIILLLADPNGVCGIRSVAGFKLPEPLSSMAHTRHGWKQNNLLRKTESVVKESGINN
jgi:hypothetical protein